MSQENNVAVTPNFHGEETALTSSHPRIEDHDDGEIHLIEYARLGKRVFKAPCAIALCTHTQLEDRIKDLVIQVQNLSRSLETATQLPQFVRRRSSPLRSKLGERRRRSITV